VAPHPNTAPTMTAKRYRSRAARRAHGAGGWLTAAAFLALVAACNLDVTTPSRLPAERLDSPASAALLVSGAQADLTCALGAWVVVSGLVSGELSDATQTASRWSYDRRDVDPGQAQYSQESCEDLGVYTPLQTARYSNDNALTKLQGWTDEQVPNRQKMIAQTAAYAGYAVLFLGEGFCEAPAEQLGPSLTQPELFQRAEDYFTTALTAAQAAGDDDLATLAYAGRARAHLDQGELADAGADAANVPADFVYSLATTATPSRLQNLVFAENNQGVSVNIGQSYRDSTLFPVDSIDPNVRTASDDRQLWTQHKYTSLTDPLILATGAEAQLIAREASGEDIATIIEARRETLYLEGTRMFDLQRFNVPGTDQLVPLVPAPGTQYPFQGQAKGGSYSDLGGKRCLPLPDVERLNNPNIGG
jgi:starch-binding outer membrane protein, SusD/RagB family